MGGFRSFVQLLLRGLSSSFTGSGPTVIPPTTIDAMNFGRTVNDGLNFQRTISDVIDF